MPFVIYCVALSPAPLGKSWAYAHVTMVSVEIAASEARQERLIDLTPSVRRRSHCGLINRVKLRLPRCRLRRLPVQAAATCHPCPWVPAAGLR